MGKVGIIVVIAVFVSVLLSFTAAYMTETDAEIETATLTYVSNGSYVSTPNPTSSSVYEKGAVVDLLTPSEVSAMGWKASSNTKTFVGWAESHDGALVYVWDKSISSYNTPTVTLDRDVKLYAVWDPFSVTIHQPVEYGSIKMKTDSDGTYADLVYTTSDYSTGVTLYLKFYPISGLHVNYWVINGEKVHYGESEIQVTITYNTEISLFVEGQTTDFYSLPSTFQAVDYVENYDGAYIDTGYIPNYNTKVVASYETATKCEVGNTFALYGSRPSSSFVINTFTFWVCSNAGNGSMRYDGGRDGAPISKMYEVGSNYDIVSYKTSTKVSIDGGPDVTLSVANVGEFYTSNSMYIFRMNGNGFTDLSKITSSIRLHSFTISEGPDEDHMTAERNFIPCIYIGENGVIVDSAGASVSTWQVGFYDTVYGQFYTKATKVDAGHHPELIAGPYDHTIGFQTLGGEKRQEVITYQSLGDLDSLIVNIPYSPVGKTFRGYYLNGTVQVFDSEGRYNSGSLTIETDYVLTDAWEDVYVSFYRNLSGAFDKEDLIQKVGPTYEVTMGSLPDREVTIEGVTNYYRFVCWSDSSGNSYLSGEVVEFGLDTDLFAIWKQDDEHTLIYHYNDGTGKTIKIVGNRVNAMDGPVRSGYEFYSWNDETGSGTPIFPGDPIDLISDVDLYAQWKYTIVFNRCGGTGGTASTSFISSNLTAHIDIPSRDQLVFCGYSSLSGTVYYDADGNRTRDWDVHSNATLEAIWGYTVTIVSADSGYNPGSGWIPVDGQNGTFQKIFEGHYDASAQMPLTDPSSPSDSRFVGWDGTNLHLATGGQIVIDENKTVTATYQFVHYSATFTG